MMKSKTSFEILHGVHVQKGQIKAAIFDFDGTISTLRCGWEQVMRPLMLETLTGGQAENASAEIQKKIDDYINASTGIQTIYQMRWLKEQADAAGQGRPNRDEWWYKDCYNERLMKIVNDRISEVETGLKKADSFLICGAVNFVKQLKEAGIRTFLASGTDHMDVCHEAAILGVFKYFDFVKGAPEHQASDSKEAVMRMILEEEHIPGNHLLITGDGKVEIALGVSFGAFTLGAATDEKNRSGVNEKKRLRLIQAGADAITGDFKNLSPVLQWIGL